MPFDQALAGTRRPGGMGPAASLRGSLRDCLAVLVA